MGKVGKPPGTPYVARSDTKMIPHEYKVVWRRRGSQSAVDIHVRCQVELKRKIEKAAGQNDRTVSDEVRSTLEWFYTEMWREA